MTCRNCLLIFLFVTCFNLSGSSFAESNWPQWRGAAGTGLSDDKGLPVQWNAADVSWKTELKGIGQSSPINWGEKIFLTSALEGGRQRLVMCFDRHDGKLLWEKAAWSGEPESSHEMNLHASATCATDGERVVAFFGRGGLHCYDLEGEHRWSLELGPFAGPWGTAASPIIVGDLVIQNCDAENDAFLLGVDKRTGREVWRTPRAKLRGWSTPVLIDAGERKEIVLNGELGVNAYDPLTGKDLWFCKGDTGRGTPTVVPYKDLIIAVNGRGGDMIAVHPGGSGNVNATHEVWRTKRGGRDLPSPIVVGDELFVANLRPGVGNCYEAATGKEISQLRLEGNFSASPIAANGLIYLPSEKGEILVIKPGKEMEIVARNTFGSEANEVFRASLMPSEGQIFCRSNRVLYCIGKRKSQ